MAAPLGEPVSPAETKREMVRRMREEDDRENRTLTLFGWDIYIVAFVAIGGACVLGAIWYIFFTRLPMPRYCGTGKAGGHICGYISRDPPSPRPKNAT